MTCLASSSYSSLLSTLSEPPPAQPASQQLPPPNPPANNVSSKDVSKYSESDLESYLMSLTSTNSSSAEVNLFGTGESNVSNALQASEELSSSSVDMHGDGNTMDFYKDPPEEASTHESPMPTASNHDMTIQRTPSTLQQTIDRNPSHFRFVNQNTSVGNTPQDPNNSQFKVPLPPPSTQQNKFKFINPHIKRASAGMSLGRGRGGRMARMVAARPEPPSKNNPVVLSQQRRGVVRGGASVRGGRLPPTPSRCLPFRTGGPLQP